MVDDQPTAFVYDEARGGVFCEKYEIAPYPGQVMRMHTLKYLIEKYIDPSAVQDSSRRLRYVEIGCGNGAIAYEAYRMGFEVSVFDFNEDVHGLIENTYNADKERIKVLTAFSQIESGAYDALLASEVLEHIEDPKDVLEQWKSTLRPHGHIFLTVPAKMKYWSAVDEMAGHVLRYEKDQLGELLQECGFDNIDVRVIGFPLHTLTIGLRNVLVYKKRAKMVQNADNEVKTKMAGISKSVEWCYKDYLPYKLINTIAYKQRKGDSKDRGNILVAAARKA